MSGTVHPLSFYRKSHSTLLGTSPYDESYGQDSSLGSERVASVITECNIYVWPAGLQGFDWPAGQPMNRGEKGGKRRHKH